MKHFTTALFLTGSLFASAQQPLQIPDTLHGSVYNLAIKHDSVQFLPGNHTQTIGINSSPYLGPTLILDKGTNVSIMVNNQLIDTTTVHWHGLHVTPVNDGGPHTYILPSATWNPQFTVMDHASTYWYHAHPHMMTGMHVMKGLAGMIIVRDSAEAALNLPRTYGVDDFPIIVQTQQFDTANQVMHHMMADSIVMVNGTIDPYLDVPEQVVRLRLLNGGKERVFNFGFSNNMSFKVIGSDGGLLAAPVSLTRLRLAPGERAEILVDLAGMNGQSFTLMSYASQLGNGVQGGPDFNDGPLDGLDFNLLQLNVVAPTANPVTTIPTSLVTVTPYTSSQANTTRNITFSVLSMMDMDGPFFFNGNSFDMNRIDYTIPLNNIEIWQLTNQTMVAHPFHIHDVQFYILTRNGNQPPLAERGRKDVVLVQPMETVRFITKFEDFADTTVPYMFHCHILMHEDDGMMGQFVVSPNAVSVNETSGEERITIYPNPSGSIINLDLQNAKGITRIYNSIGKLVYTSEHPGKLILDVSLWTSGLYTVTIEQGNNMSLGRFIISK